MNKNICLKKKKTQPNLTFLLKNISQGPGSGPQQMLQPQTPSQTMERDIKSYMQLITSGCSEVSLNHFFFLSLAFPFPVLPPPPNSIVPTNIKQNNCFLARAIFSMGSCSRYTMTFAQIIVFLHPRFSFC